MITAINPIFILPSKESSSEEWVSFFKVVIARYGKQSGVVAFVKAWNKFGGEGSSANVNAIEKGTGLKLDKSLLDSIEGKTSDAIDYVGGFFSSLGTGSKILFYSTIGIAVILVGGLTIRVITLSAKDAGTVGGTAAKAFL